MSGNDIVKFPGNPMRIGERELADILIFASQNKISDILFKTGEPVWAKRHGRRIKITPRDLTNPEVGEIINLIYGNNGTAMIAGGSDVDTAYSIAESRSIKHRYRFNAVGILASGSNGYSVTLRSIPSLPPTLEEVDFPMHLLDAMSQNQGMVIVTGETGSGKSTLQAALLRHRVEQEDANLNVITFEQPIEFMFDDVVKPSSIVQQSEITRNLPSFQMGIRNAMRRDPDIILIGESRDVHTMGASVEAAKSGHLLMTTMHSNGVPSTIRRAVGLFSEGERNGMAIDIIESIKVVITQRLLRTLDGQRKAVREYLVFDEHIRGVLLDSPIDRYPAVTRELTKKYGQTMVDDADRIYKDGLISEKEFKLVTVHEKQKDIDSTVKLAGMEGSPLSGSFFDDLDGLMGKP